MRLAIGFFQVFSLFFIFHKVKKCFGSGCGFVIGVVFLFFLLLFVHMHRGKPLSLLIIYAVMPNFCGSGVILCAQASLLTPCTVFARGCWMNIKSHGSGLIALFSSSTHTYIQYILSTFLHIHEIFIFSAYL